VLDICSCKLFIS